MEEIEKYTHGGSRAGSGRRKKQDKKRPYCTKLRPDQVAWLRAKPNAAGLLEVIIDRAILRESTPI